MWEDKLSECQIRDSRAVSGAGLHGKGSPKRSVRLVTDTGKNLEMLGAEPFTAVLNRGVHLAQHKRRHKTCILLQDQANSKEKCCMQTAITPTYLGVS